MKSRYVAIMLVLSAVASPAFAWDCSVWSQSTDPTMECYVAPVKSVNTNTNNQSQTAKGGSAKQHQNQTQNQTQESQSTSSADNSGNNVGEGNSTNVNVQGDVYRAARIPVATAYVAALTSGIDTCTGSWSAGGQTAPVGISFGKTTKDENCVFVKKVHLLREFDQRVACEYMRSHDKEIDDAYKTAGIDCPEQVKIVVQDNIDPSQFVTRDELNQRDRELIRHGKPGK